MTLVMISEETLPLTSNIAFAAGFHLLISDEYACNLAEAIVPSDVFFVEDGKNFKEPAG